METYQRNIIIYSGADFEAFYSVKSNNVSFSLTGSSISARIKKYSGSSSSISINGSTIPLVPGDFKIYLSSTETEEIKPGKYMYDVVLTDSNNIKIKLVEGFAFVKPIVSK